MCTKGWSVVSIHSLDAVDDELPKRLIGNKAVRQRRTCAILGQANEDGVVDARRTHERDATGRLVRERYSGTPRLDKEPVRRDFIYECD